MRRRSRTFLPNSRWRLKPSRRSFLFTLTVQSQSTLQQYRVLAASDAAQEGYRQGSGGLLVVSPHGQRIGTVACIDDESFASGTNAILRLHNWNF